MPLQLLHDLLSLQVPNVDHSILGSANDPLSASDGKVGEYTVLLVLVARVGFEAFALRVVPQFEGVVKSGGQNVLAIRGELDKRYWWVFVVDEGFEALARGRVPYPTKTKTASSSYLVLVNVTNLFLLKLL